MSDLVIKSARHQTGHVLMIEFSDGHIQIVDFSPFIFSVDHPDYEPYKQIDRFLGFKIDDGNLNWDDHTMIFPIEDLYCNRISKRR